MSEPLPFRLRPASRRSPCLGLGVTALAIVGGCSTADIPVLFASDGDASAPSTDASERVPDASSPKDATAPGDGGTFGTLDEYCKGTGPPLLVDLAADGGGLPPTCPGMLAQRAFAYALCACDNYTSSQSLVTDAFDSANGAYDEATATPGASVGVNGNLSPAVLNIGGALWASNTSTDLTTSSLMHVQGELRTGGELNANGLTLFVGADAWLVRGIQATADVTIMGTLHVPPGAPVNLSGGSQITSTVSSASFTVPAACDCEQSDLVDVAGIVETYRTHSDDVALGLNSSMLENMVSPSAANAMLQCGRIFLGQIAPNGVPIQLTANGRVAIFVAGDIQTQSDFIIDVPPPSQVDLFVQGSIAVAGQFRVGDASNPTSTRIYVGGDVHLAGPAELAGTLYAPNGSLVLGASATTTVLGSIFVGSVSAGASLSIHYDEAILKSASASACPEPTACMTCSDCRNRACNSGTCGPCAADNQCCAPFVCDVTSGGCVPSTEAR